MKKRHLVLGGVAAVAACAGVIWRQRQEPSAPSASSDALQGEVSTGASASDFWLATVEKLDGRELPLKSLHGRPLILNFWATWCPPCVREMPMLERVYQGQSRSGGGTRWEFLGLAADRRDAVARYLERQPISYTVALAGMEGIALSRVLGNSSGSLPFTVAFGAQGQPLQRRLGELSESELLGWMASGR
jgi:thiol-disulfide isomerase/thioredoxin